jgi:hypothetical protein
VCTAAPLLDRFYPHRLKLRAALRVTSGFRILITFSSLPLS